MGGEEEFDDRFRFPAWLGCFYRKPLGEGLSACCCDGVDRASALPARFGACGGEAVGDQLLWLGIEVALCARPTEAQVPLHLSGELVRRPGSDRQQPEQRVRG